MSGCLQFCSEADALSFSKILLLPGMVVHICNPNTVEAEAGGSLQVPGQPGLHSEAPVSKQTKQIPLLPHTLLPGSCGQSTLDLGASLQLLPYFSCSLRKNTADMLNFLFLTSHSVCPVCYLPRTFRVGDLAQWFCYLIRKCKIPSLISGTKKKGTLKDSRRRRSSGTGKTRAADS